MKLPIIVRLTSIIFMCGVFSSCYGSYWQGEDSLKRARNEAVIYSVASRQTKLQGYQISVYHDGNVVAKKFTRAKLPAIPNENYEVGKRQLAAIERFDNKKITYRYRTENGWMKETWIWNK